MDTPRASPVPSCETLEQPIIDANQPPKQDQSELHRLQAEQRALKEENISLRADMQMLLRMMQDLTDRISTVEQQGSLLQHAAIDTNESLRRLRRKVDFIGDDLAVTKNEFDLGRYDV